MTGRQEKRLDLIAEDVKGAAGELADVAGVDLAIGLAKTARARRLKGLRRARKMLEAALANIKFLEAELNDEAKEGAV